MQQIALLSTSAATGLGDHPEDRLAAAIETLGGAVTGFNWLREGQALEAVMPTPVAAADLRHALAPMAADINVIPAEGRRKSLLIADMDSTIITSESLDDLARLAGKGEAVARITARSMRGELDFTQSLIERVAMLKGSSAELIETIIAEAECNPGAAALVATMRGHGARTVLASGGFTFLTEIIAGRLGFDAHFANTLDVENGIITGTVSQPVLEQRSKMTILENETAQLEITPVAVATIGDGANDRAMTEAASMGVAFRGKDALKAVTPIWLDHSDLEGLLWLQGYDESMIIRPA